MFGQVPSKTYEQKLDADARRTLSKIKYDAWTNRTKPVTMETLIPIIDAILEIEQTEVTS